MFVLDTDVVSRTSPLSCAGGVASWLGRHKGLSFLSVVTLAELYGGVERLRLRGNTRKAEVLGVWLQQADDLYASRLLSMDATVSRRAGELLARAEAAGFSPGFADACIAATADAARFEVVTFNARHFTALGVRHRAPSVDGDLR